VNLGAGVDGKKTSSSKVIRSADPNNCSVLNSNTDVPFIVSLRTAAITVYPGGQGFLCDRAAMLGDRIKGTVCIVPC